MPIVSTYVDSGPPCLNEIGYRKPNYDFMYRLEVESELYSTCTDIDSRYSRYEMDITEYDLQRNSGVLEKMELLPKYGNSVELLKKVRQQNNMSFFTRATTYWSLECGVFGNEFRPDNSTPMEF